MVQVLLIIFFGSLHLHDALGFQPPVPLAHWQSILAVPVALALVWGVFHALCARWGRLIDATGRARHIRAADTAMLGLRLIAAAIWGFGVFGLGTLTATRATAGDMILLDEALTLLPALLFLAATWWSIYPLELRLREAVLLRELDNTHGHAVHPPLTRAQYVSSGLRHQMLLFLAPLTLMTAWQELMTMHIGPWLRAGYPDLALTLTPAAEYLGILSILILSPALMRRIWDTVPVASGPLRDQVHAMCRRYRVHVRGPFVWRTHGSLVNGAILGIFYPFRYMLLTDALLERLTADQVEAVMAHEVAHVRRRHLIWLGVCIASRLCIMVWIINGLFGVLDHLRVTTLPDGVLSIVMGLSGFVAVGTVFGLVSRRFEWQADAFAVQHLSSTTSEAAPAVTRSAVATMAAALQSVADLNGIDPDRFTWRHGSVSERQRRLARLVDQPIGALPIDRQVRWIKAAAITVLALSCVPVVIQLLGALA